MSGRRGFSVLDVAIAAVLFSMIFTIAARFVLSLSDASEAAVGRSHARREVALISNLFNADFGGASTCEASGFGSLFSHINDSGGDNLGLFTDVDLDGDADLVSWRVEGATLERNVVLNTGQACSTMTPSSDWETIALGVRGVPGENSSFFTGLEGGIAVQYDGICAKTDCQFDSVRVNFITEPIVGNGPVTVDQLFPLNPRLTRF